MEKFVSDPDLLLGEKKNAVQMIKCSSLQSRVKERTLYLMLSFFLSFFTVTVVEDLPFLKFKLTKCVVILH